MDNLGEKDINYKKIIGHIMLTYRYAYGILNIVPFDRGIGQRVGNITS
jgi:hypothetical protein